MQLLNRDNGTIEDIVNSILDEANLVCDESTMIVDINFIKSFNNSTLTNMLSDTIPTLIRDDLESIFVGASTLCILQTSKNIDINELILKIFSMIETITEDMGMPIILDIEPSLQMISYISMLKYNIEIALNNIRLSKHERIGIDNIEDILTLDSFYIVCDNTQVSCGTINAVQAAYIKIYNNLRI